MVAEAVRAQVEAGLGDGSLQSPGGGRGGGETEKARERVRGQNVAWCRGVSDVTIPAASALPRGFAELTLLPQGFDELTTEEPGVPGGVEDLTTCLMVWGVDELTLLSQGFADLTSIDLVS